MSLRHGFILALLLPAATTILVAAAHRSGTPIIPRFLGHEASNTVPSSVGAPPATADRAPYRARHEGRNRVCVAELREGAETDGG